VQNGAPGGLRLPRGPLLASGPRSVLGPWSIPRSRDGSPTGTSAIERWCVESVGPHLQGADAFGSAKPDLTSRKEFHHDHYNSPYHCRPHSVVRRRLGLLPSGSIDQPPRVGPDLTRQSPAEGPAEHVRIAQEPVVPASPSPPRTQSRTERSDVRQLPPSGLVIVGSHGEQAQIPSERGRPRAALPSRVRLLWFLLWFRSGILPDSRSLCRPDPDKLLEITPFCRDFRSPHMNGVQDVAGSSRSDRAREEAKTSEDRHKATAAQSGRPDYVSKTEMVYGLLRRA